jgi:outer membrane protein
MKNGLLILNVILLIAVGVLFYLHFSKPGTDRAGKTGKVLSGTPNVPAGSENVRIAYIEMDSLENAFTLIRDVKNELARKEAAMTNELSGLENRYRNKAADYQRQGQNMNQMQSEAATKDMMQEEQKIRTRKQQLDQEYQNYYMDKMKDVKTRIEDFLKEYNKDKRYTYILAYEPGLFYYKDSTYNITNDVIQGLNKRYKK